MEKDCAEKGLDIIGEQSKSGQLRTEELQMEQSKQPMTEHDHNNKQKTI